MSDFDFQKIERLVVSAQNGNQESFERLFECFFERIHRYVQFRVPTEDVEDIVSDVFLKVVQNLNRYSVQEGAQFSSWIFRIAHNTVIDFYRKRKEAVLPLQTEEGEDLVLISDTELTPDIQMNQKLDAHLIRSLLETLNPSYKEVLELKYLEEFTNREISEILGKTEGNIRVIQLRALKALKDAWEDSMDSR